jgi:DNA-3-methyladenine glycosylase
VGGGRLVVLPRSFYARPTEKVARELIGKLLVRRQPGRPVQVARIVEVEAYLGERDLASHARRGPTPRSQIMFGPPGHLYVYLIYGMYHCMNLVTEREGVAGAVLVRAAEPVAGGVGGRGGVAARTGVAAAVDHRLLRGPGKLCRELGITLADKGLDLTRAESRLYVAADPAAGQVVVARSVRIGVDYAGHWAQRPLRFFVRGHPSVSGPRVLGVAPRR